MVESKLLISTKAFYMNMNMNVGLGMEAVYLAILLVVSILSISGLWKVFVKAGEPGFAVFIPVYNVVCLCRVARVSLWWLLVAFIPVVNIVATIWLSHNVSKNFGRGIGTTILLILGVGYAVLGFSDAAFQPESASSIIPPPKTGTFEVES
jgi:hypothetical protein